MKSKKIISFALSVVLTLSAALQNTITSGAISIDVTPGT